MFPECLKTGKLEKWKIYSGEIPRINFFQFSSFPVFFQLQKRHKILKTILQPTLGVLLSSSCFLRRPACFLLCKHAYCRAACPPFPVSSWHRLQQKRRNVPYLVRCSLLGASCYMHPLSTVCNCYLCLWRMHHRHWWHSLPGKGNSPRVQCITSSKIKDDFTVSFPCLKRFCRLLLFIRE